VTEQHRRWRLVRARSDAIPASVRRFNQRAQQRRIQAARPWFVAAAGLALVGLLLWLVYGTPVLGVRHVVVSGNTIVSTDEVRAAAGIPDGAPLASLDLGAVQRRVAALTPVRRAAVTRDWPFTVRIDVTERVGVAALARSDHRYQVIDGSGVVFQTVPADPGLPLLKLAAPGPADPTTQAALTVLAALRPPLRDDLATLEADSPAHIRLELSGNREIIWGDATQNDAKSVAATTLLAQPGTVIDVSAPQFATVH
jgi:cell division protein FtsQ